MGEDSCIWTTGASLLFKRELSSLEKFLQKIKSPFDQQFQTSTLLASLGSSLGISLLIFAAWTLIRPYNSVVYAPKLRHADSKHSPPPVGKGWFSWLAPIIKCHEDDLVDKIGMDATIFLRFMRMLRTIFIFLALAGSVIMLPVNITCNLKNKTQFGVYMKERWFIITTPIYVWGNCMYAHVIMSWAINLFVMYILWKNYREVVKLRKRYFETPEYTNSLHSRSLMIWDIPSSYRSDAGLNKLVGGLEVPTHGDEKCAIGRNVKVLPVLIEKHEMVVRQLEEVLAKYFKNPERLPSVRPTCKPGKDDKKMNQNMRVDAIEYLKSRMEELEQQIYETRKSIDKRDAMQYGFVSYPTISRAHIAAKAARGKHPKGTSMTLAARPSDIIWANIGRSKASRRWNGFIGNVLFVLLSILFVIPNALIAVFLSNLNNVAYVWPGFQPILIANAEFFSVVQGFAAPTITSIIYLLLPILMRRISIWQGDITKSSRERHVTHKLYIFFIINNLIIFTLFGAIWQAVLSLVAETQQQKEISQALASLQMVPRIANAIFDGAMFWVTYLLQRNMGALLDLAQVVSLVGKSFAIRFMSPTPRQRIEWTAPPPFDYATYYNYFLFYTTIALIFSTSQPLVLVVAALYFVVDNFLKKYSLMYVFVTKTESGGTFWRVIFNRMLFACGFSNVTIGVIVWARSTWQVAAWIAPLFFILIGFKLYCRSTFDMKARYYTRGSDCDSIITPNDIRRRDNLGERYSHPTLHRKLMKPMVPGKAEHLVAALFHESKLGVPGGPGISMANIQPGTRGKKLPNAGFEVVQEEDMDFAHFKHRAEFGEQYGGSHLYNDSYSDGYSMHTMSPSNSRPGSPAPGMRTPASPGLAPIGYRGTDYIPVTGTGPPRSPAPGMRNFTRPESPYDYSQTDHMSETEAHLLSHQQMTGRATPSGDSGSGYHHYQPHMEHGQPGYHHNMGHSGQATPDEAAYQMNAPQWQQQQPLPYDSYEQYTYQQQQQ